MSLHAWKILDSDFIFIFYVKFFKLFFHAVFHSFSRVPSSKTNHTVVTSLLIYSHIPLLSQFRLKSLMAYGQGFALPPLTDNSLPASIYPPYYDLPLLKQQIFLQLLLQTPLLALFFHIILGFDLSLSLIFLLNQTFKFTSTISAPYITLVFLLMISIFSQPKCNQIHFS